MPAILRPVFYTITPLEAFLFFPACGQRCGASGEEIERDFLMVGNDPHLWIYDASVDIGLPQDYRLVLEKRVVPVPCLPDGAPRSLPARFSDVMEESFKFEWPGYYLCVQAMYKNLRFQDSNHVVRTIFWEPPGPKTTEKFEFELTTGSVIGRVYSYVESKTPDVFFRPWS